MKGKPGDEIRLRHILEAILYIENFSIGKSKNDLYSEPVYRFSVERQLEIIGEAANHISAELREQYSGIPWPKIISFRNFLSHEYFGTDLELVWDIIVNNVPVLKNDIEKILADISNQ